MRNRRPLKFFLFISLPLLLASCGFVPLPVTVASLVLDGISLATTEKTVADHGLSMVSGQDCAVWRGMTGGELCRDEAGDESLLAAADKDAGEGERDDDGFDPDLLLAAADDDEPDETGAGKETEVAALADTESIAAPVVETHPLPTLKGERTRVDSPSLNGFHYVLASFANPDNAARMVRANAVLKARTVTAVVAGRTVHRVVVGPFAQPERKAAHRNLAASGFTDSWGLELGTGGEPAVLLAAAR